MGIGCSLCIDRVASVSKPTWRGDSFSLDISTGEEEVSVKKSEGNTSAPKKFNGSHNESLVLEKKGLTSCSSEDTLERESTNELALIAVESLRQTEENIVPAEKDARNFADVQGLDKTNEMNLCDTEQLEYAAPKASIRKTDSELLKHLLVSDKSSNSS